MVVEEQRCVVCVGENEEEEESRGSVCVVLMRVIMQAIMVHMSSSAVRSDARAGGALVDVSDSLRSAAMRRSVRCNLWQAVTSASADE